MTIATITERICMDAKTLTDLKKLWKQLEDTIQLEDKVIAEIEEKHKLLEVLRLEKQSIELKMESLKFARAAVDDDDLQADEVSTH